MFKLIYDSLIVFTKSGHNCFSTDFAQGANIIYGRNTSGKSTLIQLILYTMGINDSKDNLSDILRIGVTARLDCTLVNDTTRRKLSFIRDGSTIIIKEDEKLPKRFDGIDGNSSYEYRNYKQYFSKLIGFTLELESKGIISAAPLETAFLPYYISQSVGWVYLRESIGNHRYYKNFKEDFLDYYTGLTNDSDRKELIKLREEKQKHLNEIKVIDKYEKNHPELELAKAINEKFKDGAISYIEEFNELNSKVIQIQRNHIELSNKKSVLLMRQNTLGKIKRAQNKQRPSKDSCPVCEQVLPGSLSAVYKHTQEINDTCKEIELIKEKIKENQSKINSEANKLKDYRKTLISKYKFLHKLKLSNISFDTWLDFEANKRLADKVEKDKVSVNEKLETVKDQISNIENDGDLEKLRRKVGSKFLRIFKEKTKLLSLELPKGEHYQYLYDITSFPLQGVELHKLIMAYHFAFKELISSVETVHNMPFVLDAVFKEDIDEKSRELIYEFLSKQVKADEQLIFSVADYKNLEDDGVEHERLDSWIEKMNDKHFSSSAKLICIGQAKYQKAFLRQPVEESERAVIEETMEMVEAF